MSAAAKWVATPFVLMSVLLLSMPAHPLAKRKKKILPSDLSGQPFILFETGSATRRVIDSFFVTDSRTSRVAKYLMRLPEANSVGNPAK